MAREIAKRRFHSILQRNLIKTIEYAISIGAFSGNVDTMWKTIEQNRERIQQNTISIPTEQWQAIRRQLASIFHPLEADSRLRKDQTAWHTYVWSVVLFGGFIEVFASQEKK
ncbi:MAG: hypothetical protein V1776_03305 [Candidatus Diapherotrites archaeon]